MNFRHSKVFTSPLILSQGQGGDAVKASSKMMVAPTPNNIYVSPFFSKVKGELLTI
jgi:hypothetical protein